jgi:tetratricopeptide (TPR) repeat protein
MGDLPLAPAGNVSPAAQGMLDQVIQGYAGHDADTPRRLAALLEAEPGMAFAHIVRGYFLMLNFKRANVAPAREALEAARRYLGVESAWALAHAAALEHWIAGDLDRMLGVWEQILAEHPVDILAFRLHHFNAFWLGRPQVMAGAVERVLPAWHPGMACYGTILACRAFAHEELGNYPLAESSGRQAIEIDPSDVWAAHAVAHVLEMQGRHEEGVAWLDGLEPHWAGKNNLTHHLWWHRGLYHLERGEVPTVLDLYDRRFRNLASPLTEAQPDLYIDVQNAASMLFRLERLGIDPGARWDEIADKAEARIGDCLSAFTLPHWMMALVAAERWAAAERMLEGMRAFGARETGTVPALVRAYAIPVCEAIVLRGRGQYADAVDRMRPALDGMASLGGSHAQQDVLAQLFLDCAMKAGRQADIRLVLDRARMVHPVPPESRIGYRQAAAVH